MHPWHLLHNTSFVCDADDDTCRSNRFWNRVCTCHNNTLVGTVCMWYSYSRVDIFVDTSCIHVTTPRVQAVHVWYARGWRMPGRPFQADEYKYPCTWLFFTRLYTRNNTVFCSWYSVSDVVYRTEVYYNPSEAKGDGYKKGTLHTSASTRLVHSPC